MNRVSGSCIVIIPVSSSTVETQIEFEPHTVNITWPL